MKKILFLLFCLIFCGFLFCQNVKAGTQHNVSGWAWSSNIGWISFNNTTGGGSKNYGVNIETDGRLTGYAWSRGTASDIGGIGWIKFDPSGPYPGSPNYSAKLNPTTKKITGWARAYRAIDTEGQTLGGWDGWISLGPIVKGGTDYGVWIDTNFNPAQFRGWAWGGDVVGWISLSSINCDTDGDGESEGNPGCPPAGTDIPPYQPIVPPDIFNQPPEALISCDGSQCSGGNCNGNWIIYRPIADPSPCVYIIKNDSDDPDGKNDIIVSRWYLKEAGEPDSSYQLKLNCGEICNYTFQPGDVVAGDYVIKLYIEDTAGQSDFVTHDIYVRGEVEAGFMCSLNNSNWQVCESFSGKVSQKESVYFKDDPSLTEHSVASEGAVIISRQWQINSKVFNGSSSNSSTTLDEIANTVRLTVTDSAGRSDYQEHLISVTPLLPTWIEVNPF